LRWIETANTQKRAEAANALGRALNHSTLDPHERQAAQMALTYLLDDPSPKVRLALAESLADETNVPRSVILALTNDQSNIAVTIISRSPLLSDSDLVDIAGRDGSDRRAAIAVRKNVSRSVTAAIAEVGNLLEIILLLRNPGAQFTTNCLIRLASRMGGEAMIRELLLARPDLPPMAHQILIEKLGEALSNFSLVRASLPSRKIDRMRREACDSALISVIASVAEQDLPQIVEHLRKEGRLTTSLLIHALCAGKTVFFADAISNLSGVARPRARSILATGRPRAVRALMEAAGIGRNISDVFCDAISIWRDVGSDMPGASGIFSRLAEKCRTIAEPGPDARSLFDIIERLALVEMRQFAHRYVDEYSSQAA
jgi:uncharacterized protein (DUF2336 family)